MLFLLSLISMVAYVCFSWIILHNPLNSAGSCFVMISYGCCYCFLWSHVVLGHWVHKNDGIHGMGCLGMLGGDYTWLILDQSWGKLSFISYGTCFDAYPSWGSLACHHTRSWQFSSTDGAYCGWLVYVFFLQHYLWRNLNFVTSFDARSEALEIYFNDILDGEVKSWFYANGW